MKRSMCHFYIGGKNVNYIGLLNLYISSFLTKGRLSVAWVLVGNETVGSSRIHGINISNYFNGKGVDSEILQKPHGYYEQLLLGRLAERILLDARPDIVVFQRVNKGTSATLAKKLSLQGTKTVFIMADLFDTNMPFVCDHTIVTSECLKAQLVNCGVREDTVSVIPDPIETDYLMVKSYSDEPHERIKIVWVGAEGNWPSLNVVQKALLHQSLSDYELVTISNHPLATIRWDLETVWDRILDCDVAVIPVDMTIEGFLAKSNNRLTMFKALGLPVICSPLDCYNSIIRHAENGYLASSEEEWILCLQSLRDPSLRWRMGLADREKIFEIYGIENIGKRYLNLFSSIAGKNNVQKN